MYKQILTACTLFGTVLFYSCSTPADKQTIDIIPQPKSIETHAGNFTVKNNLTIGYADAKLEPAARYLQEWLGYGTGYTINVAEGKGDISLAVTANQGIQGAYTLEVTPKEVRITGNTYGGVISGIETVRQLLPPSIESATGTAPESELTLPAVNIADAPRFEWRGFMLDVSRHFYTKEEVKQVLDLMALYKLNKFHWHLTDDQGWRIEIKQYPLLTEKGAWRTFNTHDRGCMELAATQDNPDYLLPESKLKIAEGDTLYGGFYTQEDIREIVAYAAQRGIDVLPEIDMPGHFLAAVTHYSHVSCSDKPGWGKMFSSPVCPGKDEALEFCKNVYSEVFGLFPYEYVHLGADEVEKTNWKKCPDCQKRMRRYGLKDENELQAWFVKDMEKFFNAHGKRLIGWDEILDGGLSSTATIMWWRNWAGDAVPKATAQGNHAIITPNFTLYFDAQQDKKTLRNVYDYEPVPEGLDEKQKSCILGAQANVWCEWIPSFERMQYMTMPRIMALSEICWVEPSSKDWENFQNKMVAHLPRLEELGVNYRIPDLEGFHSTNAFIGEGTVDISCIAPGVQIRYTTDGSVPTEQSALYTEPVKVTETTDFIFRTFRPNGKKGDMVKTRFVKSEMAPATKTSTVETGLKAVWHEYRGSSCKEIENAPVNGEYIVPDVRIPEEVKGNIGLVLTGYFDAPADSIYTFALLSDDGSLLYIDNELVVDNDGPHSPREVIGQKALAKGLHPVKILYFDYNGGKLQMQSADINGVTTPFPAGCFKH